MCADLNIDAQLSEFGDPMHTRSSVLGLMVRRDVDITVACPNLDTEAVAQLGTRLARHERTWKVGFRNSTGSWNVEPEQFPDGLYLQLGYGPTSQPRPAGPRPALSLLLAEPSAGLPARLTCV